MHYTKRAGGREQRRRFKPRRKWNGRGKAGTRCSANIIPTSQQLRDEARKLIWQAEQLIQDTRKIIQERKEKANEA
jgi:hypothetical protein